MLHDIQGPIFQRMRIYARLEPTDLGKMIGRSERTIKRLEANDRELMVSAEMQRAIHEATNVSKSVFGSIAAAALGEYLGVNLVPTPRGFLVPTFELLESVDYLAANENRLRPADQRYLRGLLAEVQPNFYGAERMCTFAANEIRRVVDEALEAEREAPSDDDED